MGEKVPLQYLSKSTNSTKWTEFEYMREKVPLAIVEIDEFDEMDEIRIHWREGTPSIFVEIDEFDEMDGI